MIDKNLLYKRYYDTMEKYKENSIIELPKQLFRIYLNNPNESNFIALMGCLDNLLSKNPDINFFYVDKLYGKFLNEKQKEMINPKKKLVVQLARIPCANCGYELRNLINTYSDNFISVYILGQEYHASYKWSLFRKFPYEFFWKTQKEQCIELIKKADIIHAHHLWDFEEIPDLIKDKIIITTLYDISSSGQKKYQERVKKYSSFITVADQPLQKEIFKELTTYSLPIVRFLFNESIIKNNPVPVVVFAPTIKNLGNDLPLCSKRREEVLEIIERLKKEMNFEFDLIEGIPYEENLDRKRKADIIIDDMNDKFEEFHCTCFSDDTKVLTESGWKYFKDLKMSDKIYSLNEKKKIIELSKIKRIIKQNYNGKLINLKKQNIDLLITPNHRVVYHNGYKDKKLKIKPIKDLISRCRIDIPTSGFLYEKLNSKTYNKTDAHWAKFLGLFLSDGYSHKNHIGFHIRKKSTIKMLKKCLRKLHTPYTEYTYNRNNVLDTIIKIRKPDTIHYDELRKYGKTHDKFIPSYLFKSHPNIIKEFLNGFIEGDGSINKNNQITIYNSNKNLLEDIQQLYVLIGVCTNIIRTYNKQFKKYLFRIVIRKSKNIGIEIKKHIKFKKYKGKVVCIELKTNSLIYVKRKEKCCWSGNSLEAACFGAIPLTSYSGEDYPFTKTNIKTLESTLRFYINNPKKLKEEQRRIVEWRKTYYTPKKLLLPYETLYQNLLENKQIKKSKIIEIIPIEPQTEEKKEIVVKSSPEKRIEEIFNILNENKIYYWAAKDTLLSIFKNMPIDTNIIKIGTTNNTIKQNILILLKDIDLKIEIEIRPNQEIKKYRFLDMDINVPKPLIKYLEYFTKKSFKKI